MRPSRDEASAALADIELIAQRVKQSSIYRASSLILIGWGVLVVVGNLAALFAGPWTPRIWFALNLVGVAMTIAMLARTRQTGGELGRFLSAYAMVFFFGLICSQLLGKMGPREQDAFWPTLFMLGYGMAGLFIGRAFTLIGIGLTVLIIAGYEGIGAGYDLYLAVVNGGGLMLCGYWMRRA